jgi:putative addiction module killer protein/probable addiction module antidote protein
MRHYLTQDERDVYEEWHSKLRDLKARIAIDRRINRIELGNFGDHKFCWDGVWELRIDVGPGYRIYYAVDGEQIVLLLCGGRQAHARCGYPPGMHLLAELAEQKKLKEKREMRDRSHDEAMAERFQKDPAYAVELLNNILEDGEQAELLIALRQMTKAFGGVQTVAENANLNPTQLYRTLSEQGNPELRSLSAILKAMGLRLAVQRVTAA